MKTIYISIPILLLFISQSIMSQKKEQLSNSKVDYASFTNLTQEVTAYREARLVPLPVFIEYQKDENTILLDTRSKDAYNKKHLKGAVHLNFSDFTEDKLKKLIPNKDTRILIYCNNNIQGDKINFASKMVPLALNIPTFINLYGYGYKNIYELSSLVPVSDKRIQFSGWDAK